MTYLADADDVFRVFMTLVFMFVAFMGWVGQFMKNRQQGAQRRPAQRPKQQNDRVQNEIERFLQEVTGQKPAAQQQPERPRPQAETKPAAPPRRPPTRRVERRSERAEGSRSSQSTAEKPRRVARRASEGTEGTPSTTASSASSGSQTPIAIPPRVSGSAGRRTGDMITTLGSTIAEDLRNPEQVRKAIVMNMILGPPKSSQTKSDGGLVR